MLVAVITFFSGRCDWKSKRILTTVLLKMGASGSIVIIYFARNVCEYLDGDGIRARVQLDGAQRVIIVVQPTDICSIFRCGCPGCAGFSLACDCDGLSSKLLVVKKCTLRSA